MPSVYILICHRLPMHYLSTYLSKRQRLYARSKFERFKKFKHALKNQVNCSHNAPEKMALCFRYRKKWLVCDRYVGPHASAVWSGYENVYMKMCPNGLTYRLLPTGKPLFMSLMISSSINCKATQWR